MRRPVLLLCITAVMLSACTSGGAPSTPTAIPSTRIAAPEEYIAPAWEGLDGDAANDAEADVLAKFAEVLAAGSDLSEVDAASAVDAARSVLAAEATGEGVERYAGYVPDGLGMRQGAYLTDELCTDFETVAVSPQRLPVVSAEGTDRDSYAKVLVAWRAVCPAPRPGAPSADDVSVSYVYLRRDLGGWEPARPATIPRVDVIEPTGVLPEWALEPLTGCSDPGIRVRLEVAFAWEELCAAARTAGVALRAVDGWRDAADQARRFADAVEYFGSEEVASRFVATATAISCASAHCVGEAIDVDTDPAVLAWLNTTVACADGLGAVRDSAGCNPGEIPVPRAATFGFTLPLASSPGHLEWALPLEDLDPADDTVECSPPASKSVPEVIAQVWRCRLASIGVVGDEATEVVARALVVARCASGWNPSAVAFGGRYRTEAHPATGAPYDGVGLFQIPPAWFEAVVGPSRSLTDPIANADAAALIYVRERTLGRDGFDPFPCAAANDGVITVSVLPEFGGDTLPEWAYAY